MDREEQLKKLLKELGVDASQMPTAQLTEPYITGFPNSTIPAWERVFVGDETYQREWQCYYVTEQVTLMVPIPGYMLRIKKS